MRLGRRKNKNEQETSLLRFFCQKKIKKNNDTQDSTQSLAVNESSSTTHEPSTSKIEETKYPELTGSAQYSGEIDIAGYVKQNIISGLERYNILKNAFVPDKHFIFPYSVHRKKDKDVKCYLSSNHFTAFNWLTYSRSSGGLFCRLCVLFAKYGGVNKSNTLNKLVVTPLHKYSKLFGKHGDLMTHDSSKYHKEAVTAGNSFIHVYENPKHEISNILDAKRFQEVNENRERLKAIIRSIIFCGKQNIALRGWKTESELTVSSEVNEGNLREFIRHRIETRGDDSHFE
ncbi:unnamed protein product [Psylliodes chrysocephalus]|uniref:52 kDa repressor of the inhibitor of the protein kinase-like n=1 Tax=Psylliodes chrysocephalus TaxID=3402493 RepID=A0A9P0CG43_9CUCU|nr:unnamed protein product [Psylliodes chrysocephala]